MEVVVTVSQSKWPARSISNGLRDAGIKSFNSGPSVPVSKELDTKNEFGLSTPKPHYLTYIYSLSLAMALETIAPTDPKSRFFNRL